jgi:hypothetical protein
MSDIALGRRNELFYPGDLPLVNISRVIFMRQRFAAAVALFTLSPLVVGAQGAVRVPLTGTVAPGAVGRPVQPPPPIGGLRTTPLSRGDVAPLPPDAPRHGSHFHGGVIPLRVIDAPLLRGGAVVMQAAPQAASGEYAVPRWWPTADRPHWRADPSAERVDAWRDLIVSDIVCTGSGVCLERESRVRARWAASCGCYLFADGLNRIWRVE